MVSTRSSNLLRRRKSESRKCQSGKSLRRFRSSPSVPTNTPKKMIATEKSTAKVLVMDLSSVKLKVEESNTWGYLVKVGGETYTLDRQLGKRQDNQSAGYIIGQKKDCDIKLDNIQGNDVHAIIYCRHKSANRIEKFVPYIFDRSIDGTWINFQKMKSGGKELRANDIIHFRNPKTFNEAENPTYKFLKPRSNKVIASSVEDLYKMESHIAEGAYGTVQLAECKNTKKRVAIKLIENSKYERRQKLHDAFLKEISVCMSMPVHPCIIQISKVYEQDGTMYIVMEYGKNGDLFESVAAHQFKEYEIKVIFDQLAHAIAFLHDQNIVHRDIKLENVVIFDREKLIVKLCDFGLSTFMKSGVLLETNCGTIMYAAPELVDCPKGYGKEVDVWSLGVLLFTALAAFTPFSQQSETEEHKRETIRQIKKGDFNFNSHVWKTISEDAKDLIKKMMTVDKSKRYTIKQVIAHPWLKNIESSFPDSVSLTRNSELVSYLERNMD